MDLRDQLLRVLQDAVLHPDRLHEQIQEYQRVVWECLTPDVVDTALANKLRELAYDLDFYEPDESLRGDSDAYFGKERAVDLIRATLLRLERAGRIRPI